MKLHCNAPYVLQAILTGQVLRSWCSRPLVRDDDCVHRVHVELLAAAAARLRVPPGLCFFPAGAPCALRLANTAQRASSLSRRAAFVPSEASAAEVRVRKDRITKCTLSFHTTRHPIEEKPKQELGAAVVISLDAQESF